MTFLLFFCLKIVFGLILEQVANYISPFNLFNLNSFLCQFLIDTMLNQYDNFDNVELADSEKNKNCKNNYAYEKIITLNFPEKKRYDFISINSMRFTHTDLLLITLITFISFWTRNFMLQFPSKPVFDELTYGPITNNYIDGTYFEDQYPPLGKLILFAFASLNQYQAQLNFSNNSEYPSVDFIGIRQCSALFSSFCPTIIYTSLRCFGFSILCSFTASIMIICENSMIVSGRFISIDGIHHFFVCLTFMSTSIVMIQKNYTPSWWLALFFNGISIGCLISIKLSSLSLFPFVCLIHVFQLLTIHQEEVVKKKNYLFRIFIIDLLIRVLFLLFMIIFIYFFSFVIHFILLPYFNYQPNYLSRFLDEMLIRKNENPTIRQRRWSVRALNMSLIRNTFRLTKAMNQMNHSINESFASKWYTWPILTNNWVLFHSDGETHITCFCQIVNSFLGTLSMIVTLFCAIYCFYVSSKAINFDQKIRLFLPLTFLFGYCLCYFPYAFRRGEFYACEYIIPNILGIVNFSCLTEVIFIYNPKIKGIILVDAQILSILAFLFWSPTTYGIFDDDFDFRILNTNWHI